MRNVMARAWEIAREGVKNFGGKVKEYFAQALAIAWAEVKEVVEIGFQKMGSKNGTMFFVVNDVEGLEVSFLTSEKNFYNGKISTKRNKISGYRLGTNNKTGQKARLYTVAVHCGDIEITLGDKIEVVKNSYDKSVWG